MRSAIVMAVYVVLHSGCGPNAFDDAQEQIEGFDGKGDSTAAYIVIGDQDSWLKRTTQQSGELERGSEKCSLYAGSRVEIQEQPELEGSHYLINTRTMIPGCEFSRGYVFAEHVTRTSRPSPVGDCHANLSARTCAFLGTIAYAEGTGAAYNLSFTSRRFSSYADHPRRVYCSHSGFCSDAAGRYQFLSTTWDGLGRPDFSPANQDLGALQLMAGRGVRNLDDIHSYSAFSQAIRRLNREWASLPGSPYGQPVHSMDTLWAVFQQRLGQ